MSKTIILLLFLIPFLVRAQTDLLILKKRGMQIHTYTIGSALSMETIYNQWFDGFLLTRTRLTNCRIGKRFQLDYLVLNPNKKEDVPN